MTARQGTGPGAIWLVSNPASGGNDGAALDALRQCCGEHGLDLARHTVFPDQALPTPAVLDSAGIECVAVYAGDGTVNGLIAGLAGWGGAVLVLPGGTMNLLYRRLHGQRTLEQTIAAVGRGASAPVRPPVIRTPLGDAYADFLAGPGTSWGRVREAMRAADVAELAQSTVGAIDETLTGEQIVCLDPPLGRREGYPLLSFTPGGEGIEVEAYYAEGAGDYLAQTLASFKRDFREGPHERLGTARRLTIASTQRNAFGLLIDGEQAEADSPFQLALAQCEVDLLATEAHGDRP
jgi:hypothetical protein